MSAGKSPILFAVLLQHHARAPGTLSLHISMVLSKKSVPPQSMAPMSSENAYFEEGCPYGLPRLLRGSLYCLLVCCSITLRPPEL
jgi:hypothetical protein